MSKELELPQFPWKHILSYLNGEICFDVACDNTIDEIYQMIVNFIEEMRDATPEEIEHINNYIDSISIPTGINFFDIYEREEENGTIK